MGRFIIPDSEHGNLIEEALTKESDDVNDAGDAGDANNAGDNDTNDMKSSQHGKKSIKSRRKIKSCGGNEFKRNGVVSIQDRAPLPLPSNYLFLLSLSIYH